MMGRIFWCATAMILATIAGCEQGRICYCPEGGCDQCSSSSPASTAIPLPSGVASVSTVTTDAPCSATLQSIAIDGLDSEYSTTDRILVSRIGPGWCTVYVVFTSGATAFAKVKFAAISGACGCSLGANDVALEPVDASAGQ